MRDRATTRRRSTQIIVMGDWIAWSSQSPIIAAQLNDYFTDEGLVVELISPPMRAMRSNTRRLNGSRSA